jgi:predicted O-methyltransferase YrrM
MEDIDSPERRGGLPVQRPCHRWVEVDQYIADRLLGDDPAIERGDLPSHDVSAPQGALLELLARLVGARAVLEIGTLAGYSTRWLARALPPGGRVVTLEAEPRYAEVARRNLAGFDAVEVIVGPALETLPRLEGPFDLVFIDADKRSNAEYLAWALRLSRPGTLIVADNVVRGGEIADGSSADPSVQGVRAFFDAVAAEPRLRATAIQTVGSKGYDGFALALVG